MTLLDSPPFATTQLTSVSTLSLNVERQFWRTSHNSFSGAGPGGTAWAGSAQPSASTRKAGQRQSFVSGQKRRSGSCGDLSRTASTRSGNFHGPFGVSGTLATCVSLNVSVFYSQVDGQNIQQVYVTSNDLLLSDTADAVYWRYGPKQ